MGIFSELFDLTEKEQSAYVNSIMTGVVKEVWNSKYPGMVKVEFILSDTEKKISDWVRVTTPYGGNAFGMYTYPEIGSEVVIAFVMGDINSPVIIGCLWNNKDALPEKVADEKNTKKTFLTKGGNQILISDEEGKESIQIITKEKLAVQLDDEKKVIQIADEKKENSVSIDSSKGEITINASKKITLTAGSESIVLDGTSKKMQLTGSTVSMEGQQGLSIKSSSTLKAQGAMVELKADSNFKAEAGAMMQIKGAMAKIN